MRVMAALLSIVVLLLFWLLAHHNPYYGLFSPRTGGFGLGASLVLANVALWAAEHLDLAFNQRFQFALAAWLWITVQLGCVLYLLHMAGA